MHFQQLHFRYTGPNPSLNADVPHAFTLSGFERIDGVEYMQSQIVRRDGIPSSLFRVPNGKSV